jgi:carbon monoxide dehydrogenase subunit G
MKPVAVTTTVPQPVEEVFDFLDVLANHEPFTDHMLRDWHYEGPPRGVGARARVKATLGGRTETVEFEVVAAEEPTKIVEQNVGAGGRRVAKGTYLLEGLPDGSTKITFQYSWQRAPLSERLAAPLVRSVLRRANERAMQRLREQLATRQREEIR